MDNLQWAKGKRLKDFIEHSSHDEIALSDLAVVLALVSREQNISMDDVVQQLSLAFNFEYVVMKIDKAKTLKELGF